MRNCPGVPVADAVNVTVPVTPEPEKLKVKESARAAGVKSIAASVSPERVSRLRLIGSPLLVPFTAMAKKDAMKDELDVLRRIFYFSFRRRNQSCVAQKVAWRKVLNDVIRG